MAFITRESNGHKTIQFVAADKKRRSVRLGKCSMGDADEFRRFLKRSEYSDVTVGRY